MKAVKVTSLRWHKCPRCGRAKFVVRYRGDDTLSRIRSHKMRPEGVPPTDIPRLAPCPGSRSVVATAACVSL